MPVLRNLHPIGYAKNITFISAFFLNAICKRVNNSTSLSMCWPCANLGNFGEKMASVLALVSCAQKVPWFDSCHYSHVHNVVDSVN